MNALANLMFATSILFIIRLPSYLWKERNAQINKILAICEIGPLARNFESYQVNFPAKSVNF